MRDAGKNQCLKINEYTKNILSRTLYKVKTTPYAQSFKEDLCK